MSTITVAGYAMPTLYDEARDEAAKSLAEGWLSQWQALRAGSLSESMYGVGKRFARKELLRLGHHRVAVDRLGRAIEKVTS